MVEKQEAMTKRSRRVGKKGSYLTSQRAKKRVEKGGDESRCE